MLTAREMIRLKKTVRSGIDEMVFYQLRYFRSVDAFVSPSGKSELRPTAKEKRDVIDEAKATYVAQFKWPRGSP